MAMNAPARIHAKIHGSRITLPGGSRRLVGGWDEDRYGGTTEYVRGDIAADMLAALKAVSDGTSDGRETALLVLAAIAKAEGK